MFALGEVCGAANVVFVYLLLTLVFRALDRRKEAKRRLVDALRSIAKAETVEASRLIASSALVGIEP